MSLLDESRSYEVCAPSDAEAVTRLDWRAIGSGTPRDRQFIVEPDPKRDPAPAELPDAAMRVESIPNSFARRRRNWIAERRRASGRKWGHLR